MFILSWFTWGAVPFVLLNTPGHFTININTDDTGGPRYGVDKNGGLIILHAQSIPRHRGSQHGRDSGYAGKNQKGTQFHRRQTDHISKNIFWRTRYKEQNKYQQIEIFTVLQEMHGLDFFPANERLYQFDPEQFGKKENDNSADGVANQAQNGSFKRAESIPGSQFNRLAGQYGEYYLKHVDADKRQLPQQAVRIHPGTESLGMLERADQRLP